MLKSILFIATCLFSFSALAEPEPTRPSPPDVYEVEVIVFQNIQIDLEGNEIWVNERVNLEFEDIDKAVDVNSLPRENSDLTKAFAVLDTDSSYRVLTHKQWVQNAGPQADSKLVRLFTEDGDLSGTLKFFVSRFLHVDLNLVYQQKESSSFFQAGNTDENTLLAFQLREKRRIRSDEIQYFDHPKFGALVQVKKIKK